MNSITDASRPRMVSRATTAEIFEDAVRTYDDGDHPCHVFRSLQPEIPDEAWQLPEPFNGHSANAGIVFLGLNPSYDPGEDVPRIGCAFDAWDRYYRARLDSPSQTWHKLYKRCQRVGELAVGPTFRLGIDGMVIEVIRFRSAQGAGCHDAAVLAHELPITRNLLAELAPRVVVANGADALGALQALWSSLQKMIPAGTPLLTVEHARVVVDLPWGAVTIIPARHLSAAFGYRSEMLGVVGELVRRSLVPGENVTGPSATVRATDRGA